MSKGINASINLLYTVEQIKIYSVVCTSQGLNTFAMLSTGGDSEDNASVDRRTAREKVIFRRSPPPRRRATVKGSSVVFDR